MSVCVFNSEDHDLKKKLLVKKLDDNEEELSLVNKMWKESKLMWVVAGPAIFTRISTFGIQIISQAFVGHIGSKELAAYALVFTVLVRFVNGILVC
jgi:MATE family multidrug resistance protein